MIFSSIEFIYLFLPPVLLGFLALKTLRMETAVIWWLILASLVFYICWSPVHLLLLLASVGVNFYLHKSLQEHRSKFVLAFGVTLNLTVLAIFKYADFLLQNFAVATGFVIPELGLILPLAISFYTFQQISFLCDTYRGNIIRCDFKRYLLFVTFFPQLIAGPIVLQKDTIPQFNLSTINKRYLIKFSTGVVLFSIGLFKKIILADSVAPFANAVFSAADGGQALSQEEAWIGAIAYTFQIYFDFSGYCDMAIGLALMFGIRLPINFNSPYKSLSIIEFWRRWHITLSRFLRDYLYIPLGGNRYGLAGAKGNLVITMLLGGLWHGAGWNFVIWGGLHGAYLIVNHAWSASYFSDRIRVRFPLLYLSAAWALTMLCVVIAWVFFRAETFEGAMAILQAMAGYHAASGFSALASTAPLYDAIVPLFVVMLLIVIGLPNSIEITRSYNPVLQGRAETRKNLRSLISLKWRPGTGWAMMTSALVLVSVIQIYRLNDLTEFIYFNF